MVKQATEKRKTVTINPHTHRKLRVYAVKTDRQIMDIIDESIDDFLKKKKNKEIVEE